jgi:glycosyltransferase involved in cell wall biosynthesis
MLKSYQGIIMPGQSKAKDICKIAVIIALHNQGQYLKDAVESVYKNSYHPQEVIIVDDCSTDDSAVKAFDIVAEYKGRLPGIKLIKNEVNKGLAGARNVGIMGSRSPWLVCLDADDKLELNYFETMVKWQNASKCDILYTDAVLFGSVQGRVQWPCFDALILRTRNICFASSLFSREAMTNAVGMIHASNTGLRITLCG